MANPQTENGYTKIANELLEKIYALPISGGEFRLLLMVIRKTYGHGKKTDIISLSQFTKETGVDRSNVCKIIKSVVAKKLLHKAKSAYSINKNHEGWVVAKTPLVVARTPLVVAKTPHTKESIKAINNINNIKALNNNKQDQEKDLKNKNKYEDFVFLSEKEYSSLVEKLGESKTKEKIKDLNVYLGSHGIKKYKSHYYTILNWIRMEEKRDNPTPEKSSEKQYGFK